MRIIKKERPSTCPCTGDKSRATNESDAAAGPCLLGAVGLAGRRRHGLLVGRSDREHHRGRAMDAAHTEPPLMAGFAVAAKSCGFASSHRSTGELDARETSLS